MKKKLVGAMLVGVLSVAGFAVATTSTQNGQNQSGQSQINNQMQAKDGMGKGMREGKGFEMFQNLNLTDAQKTEIKKIMEEERTQKQGDRETFKNLSLAEREKKMKESRDALNTKIRKILTADQQKVFDAKNTEMQQKMESAKKEFNLTADQQKKLDAINAKYNAEFEKIQNAKLTGQERREKMKTLKDATKKEADSVFTDTQKKLMQDGKGFGKGLGMGRDDMGMEKGFKDGMGRDGQPPMTPPQN